MIVKYAKVNPTLPFDGTYVDTCEWVWSDKIIRVVHLGIHEESQYSGYRYSDSRGETPFRCYMLVHEDGACDSLSFGINDRIEAYILSDEGKTIDRL